MILLLKAACLWSCILACVCSHSLCIKLPWPTLLTIRYLIYISIFLLPHRVCCHWLSAMPAQHMKAPEQAREDTSPAKTDVTSKSPVGDISVVTLIRTDNTTLDVYGCSSHVHMYALASHLFSVSFQSYWMFPEGNPLGSQQKRCLPCYLPASPVPRMALHY